MRCRWTVELSVGNNTDPSRCKARFYVSHRNFVDFEDVECDQNEKFKPQLERLNGPCWPITSPSKLITGLDCS